MEPEPRLARLKLGYSFQTKEPARLMKRFLPLLAIAVAATAAFAQSGPKAMVGKPAPAFKMTDTKGKVHTNKSLKGKVVLLDFWATWCGPCKAASPTMQKLHTKFAKSGLVVIGANTFERGNAKAATVGYQKEHKYTYTFTYNNDTFARALGVRGIPAFVFLGKDGKIAEAMIGYGPSRDAEMEALIKKLLAA
jgi:cytochrome c biogenesis protein CcmG, thiol:disulfide interchange protein DsbE